MQFSSVMVDLTFLCSKWPYLILSLLCETTTYDLLITQGYKVTTFTILAHKGLQKPSINLAEPTKKAEKSSMEDEIKTLQKHMGGLVKTILELKKTVEVLERRVEAGEKAETKQNAEIKETIKMQC